MGTRWPETCWATYKGEINIILKVTSSWSLYPHWTTMHGQPYIKIRHVLCLLCFTNQHLNTIQTKFRLRVAPWLKWLVVRLSSRSPALDRRSVPVRFVVDKVELGQITLRVVLLSAVNTIPPTLHTHILPHIALTRKVKRRGAGTF